MGDGSRKATKSCERQAKMEMERERECACVCNRNKEKQGSRARGVFTQEEREGEELLRAGEMRQEEKGKRV